MNRKSFIGYCPKGFETQFDWQTKKSILGKLTTFLWLYISKTTLHGDKTRFKKIKVTIEEIS